jgi:TolA-binding protein
MSEVDSSELLREIAQQLGLSHISASLIDREPISDVSWDGSGTSMFQGQGESSHGFRSFEVQLNRRDIVIDSIRQPHRRQMDALHEKLRQMETSIQSIRQRFKEKIDAMNQRFLEERNEIRATADAEIERIKDLNRAHRQNLAFSRLPQITPEEYESLTTAH